MDVTRKDAAITETSDDSGPGTFEAILSAPTKDRDGDTLLPDEWKMPLPEHITVDMDHGMSVASTIGSARPWIDEKGNLRISGTFASTPRAQEVRTLMQEGHINRTSVAFMSERLPQKDGTKRVVRELLNAAIVAIPANREAVVLSAKGLGTKAGRRNSAADQTYLDEIVRSAIALGGRVPEPDADDVKSYAIKGVVEDAIARRNAGDLTADEALTLIRDASADPDEDPTDGGEPDEEADAGAPDVAASDAAKAASDAVTKAAPVEDASIDQQVMAARMRAYHVNIALLEGN